MRKKRKVWLFFLVAFGWSWLFWIPAALIASGWSAPLWLENFLNSPFNQAAWGPLIAALLVVFLEQGKAGVRKLLKRGLDFRFGLAWYLIIVLLFPMLIGGSLLLAILTGEPVPDLPALANPLSLPIAFVYILFLGGPLQEEFGWRGYALKRFQERWSALVSSIVVGFAWGLWHLPLFFMPRQELYYQRPIWGLILSTTLVSVLFTWLYNNTDGSVFAALLFHTMFNWSHYVFPTLGSDRASLIMFLLLFIVVAGILIVWGPKNMECDKDNT
jgi:hypothetical protein